MKSKVIQTACLSLVCVIALLTVFFDAPANCYGFEISIDVAPNVLNIKSEGRVVTVHTDIAYGEVDAPTVSLNSTLSLNGVAIYSWKADNRGYFVAKFLMIDIKELDGLVIDEFNTLQLTGVTKTRKSFWGEQEIEVVDNVPAGGQ